MRKCATRKRKLWNKLHVSPHDSDLRRKYRESVHIWRELLRANEIVAFNEADIANSIDRLKCNLSAGPDGLPPMLFKKLNTVSVGH